MATKDGRTSHCAMHNPGSGAEEMTTSALVTFGIAVGGTSLICYALTRLQNRRANRGSSGDSSGDGSGNYSGEDAGVSPTGSVATIPHWIVRAIRATRAEAIAAEAATEVAEVINAAGLSQKAAAA